MIDCSAVVVRIGPGGAVAVAILKRHPTCHVASFESMAAVEGDAGGRVVHESDGKVGRWVVIVDVDEKVRRG